MKWRCYVCGEAIGDEFCLFSLSEETDRVFLCHDSCRNRLDSYAIVLTVASEKTPVLRRELAVPSVWKGHVNAD